MKYSGVIGIHVYAAVLVLAPIASGWWHTNSKEIAKIESNCSKSTAVVKKTHFASICHLPHYCPTLRSQQTARDSLAMAMERTRVTVSCGITMQATAGNRTASTSKTKKCQLIMGKALFRPAKSACYICVEGLHGIVSVRICANGTASSPVGS